MASGGLISVESVVAMCGEGHGELGIFITAP